MRIFLSFLKFLLLNEPYFFRSRERNVRALSRLRWKGRRDCSTLRKELPPFYREYNDLDALSRIFHPR